MRKRRIKKRVLAAMMTACMAVGAVPGVTFAKNAAGAPPENSMTPGEIGYTFDGKKVSNVDDAKIRLSKTASYDAEQDAYTVTLTASADQQIKMNPTEVVYLLDASGSMNFCDENISNDNMVRYENPAGHKHYELYKRVWNGEDEFLGWKCSKVERGEAESRWKIATDAIQSMTQSLGSDAITYKYAYFSNDAAFSKSETPYKGVTASGGTYLTKGINAAIDELNKADNTNKVLIVVSDGEASDGRYSTNKLTSFKNDTNNKVFTVGFAFENAQFDKVASEGCNYNASDASGLKIAFDSIKENVKGLIDDPMGDNVKLVGNASVISVDGENGHEYADADVKENRIVWKDANGLAPEKASMTYTVKVNEESKKSGEIALNGNATLNYSYNGKNYSVAFPTPSVIGAALKVEYVDDNGTVVKTDKDWIGLTGGDVSFKNITEIPETITANNQTYYVISSEPETIPTPTKGEDYKVTVRVSKEKPVEAVYSVVYDADGGSWNDSYTVQEHYELNGDRTVLTRSEMVYEDKIEDLHGVDAPEKPGFIFKGWKLGEDKLVASVPVGLAADESRSVVLKAIWEADEVIPGEAAYTVNKHYFDTDPEKSVYDEWADIDQTAKEGDPIAERIADLMTAQEYYGASYLYDHATVTAGESTEDFTENSTFKEGRTVIDIYYYRDSWNENDGSETGGDEIPDIRQVLVKFGNKDGNGTVTEKENAEKNTGIIQVYTLEDGQTVIKPSLEGVEVTAADGYEFSKWTKNDRNHAGVKPDIPQTVKGGAELDFWAWFDAKEPQDPELPDYDELKNLIGNIVLIHTGSNAEHQDAEYELIDGSYDIASASNASAVVTVKAAAYRDAYNEENGTHEVQGKTSVKLVLVHGDDGWFIEDGETPVTFIVKCSEKKPDAPELPKYDELKNLFGESIRVSCTTDETHASEKFALMEGSYSVTRSKDDENEAVVTVRAAKYIEAFAAGEHENAGNDAARVTLFYEKEEGKWYAAEEITVDFLARCEKKAPEKQYAEVKFIVVNGTFTENGAAELTKIFEVGTKLTLADIPESHGNNSHYSDETWDKYPLGYVVAAEGTTFTITYKWRSFGGSSGGGGGSSSGSTRKAATDASGKSGRWILEGGEFTEDNGKLPSNEYLKIGDTIYGFYTYGFAIDFDRPEYYTDAAIQAKGGYREASGTWRLNGWWFCYDDGTFPHGEWKYLTWDGHSDWYYFDVDGWMEDGWLRWNNNWYYLHTEYDNTRGHMYTGWHEIDGKWYYFNTASDKGTLGAMLANTTTPDGYKVDVNGAWIR